MNQFCLVYFYYLPIMCFWSIVCGIIWFSFVSNLVVQWDCFVNSCRITKKTKKKIGENVHYVSKHVLTQAYNVTGNILNIQIAQVAHSMNCSSVCASFVCMSRCCVPPNCTDTPNACMYTSICPQARNNCRKCWFMFSPCVHWWGV